MGKATRTLTNSGMTKNVSAANSKTGPGTLIRSRIERMTGNVQEFHKMGVGAYVVRCVAHSRELRGTQRYATARLTANSESWCAGCAKDAEAVAGQRVATRTARRARTEARAARKAAAAKVAKAK